MCVVCSFASPQLAFMLQNNKPKVFIRNQRVIDLFAKRLNNLLTHFDMYDTDLANSSKIHINHLRKILKAKIDTSNSHAAAIATGFDMTMSRLYDYDYFPQFQNAPVIAKNQLVHSQNCLFLK